MTQDPRKTWDSQPLVEAAAAGDRAALERLLLHHLPDLRAYVRLHMGGRLRSREGESDLVQSICREVLRDAARFRHPGEGAFRSWLFTTALRKFSDRAAFHRAARRDQGREEPVESKELLDSYRRFASPSQMATTTEQLERVEAAFRALPDDYRQVVLLSRVVGLSRASIAAEMCRSEASVKNLLHRALVRLAEDLDEGPED